MISRHFKCMEGSTYFPACDASTLTISNTERTFLLCVLLWIELLYPSLHVFLFFYPTTVHLVIALYIVYAPYSCILAFWLVFFSCDQAALQMVFSVCPSVCLSHLFDYVPSILSSWNFQELLPMTKVRCMQKVKVKGQGYRGHNPT